MLLIVFHWQQSFLVCRIDFSPSSAQHCFSIVTLTHTHTRLSNCTVFTVQNALFHHVLFITFTIFEVNYNFLVILYCKTLTILAITIIAFVFN